MKKYSVIIVLLVVIASVSLFIGNGNNKQEALKKETIGEITLEIKGQSLPLRGKVVCIHEEDCSVSEEQRSISQLEKELKIKEYELERGSEITISFSTVDPDMIFYDEMDKNSVTTKSVEGKSFEVYGLNGSEKVYRIGVQWEDADGEITRAYYPIRVSIM
ncbi:hypothetical protein [Halobacillus aidingensis]|uniref:Uncharacterized protein n=1 Tax=Halobacillus aidingensis TaxID=240303 RepID=A0A1H0REI1_HALAD|nr:hypothetical protein [Halobacillus aidingensis]SDP27957.1 hypothetical protein SAMN05421677_11522 [Halobacillus aidingensis]